MKRFLTVLMGLTLAGGASTASPPAGGAPPESPPPRIAAEDFGALPFFLDPEISPDGKKVVAVSVLAGKRGPVVANVDGGDLDIKKIGLPEDLSLIWVRWAGPNKVLMSVIAEANFYGLKLPTTRMIVHDFATGKYSAVGDRVGGLDGDDVLYVDPAGAFMLMSAQRSIFDYPSVLRVDLNTMDARQIVKPETNVWSWYVDHTGAVRGGLGSEGEKWWLLYRESEDAKFRRIARGKLPQDQALTDVETLLPVGGTDKGYVIANKSTGRYGVYRYDFVSGAIGETVFEHPEVDIDGVGLSPRTGDLDSVLYVDDRKRTHWLDPRMKAIQARIDRALPNAVNRIVSRDAADEIMIVWSSRADDPGAYYVFDQRKKELRALASPYFKLDGKVLAPTESVRYQARDGLSIPGYLTLPVGRPAKGLPLIVMPHGGPFARDEWTYEAWVQFLANRGYAVLQPNFRGSTGFGKPYVEAATGQIGRKMQDDLDDGVAWLASRGIADPKKVCIMGASYGGYAALWGAVRNPDIYRCSISFAGVTDIRAMLRYDRSNWVARRYYRDWRERLKGPEDFDLDKVSPLEQAAKIRTPVLIAHGDKDGTVPLSQSKRLHEALQKAGIKHDYVVYPGEGHGFGKVENSVDFLKRVDAFLAKHNPAS
jgi:dipeptidyl aminopeptidase/acylaminoacyl peptidase